MRLTTGQIETVADASIVVSDGASETDTASPFLRGRPHNQHDKALRSQKSYREPTRPSLSSAPMTPTRALLSVAESSEQTLAPLAASPSGFPEADKGALEIVDILMLTTAKIVDKQSSPSGVQYKCELEPLWLAADLVESAEMGGVRIRSYENGLIREGRVNTLRSRK